jgi:hypothetical protein
VYYGPAHARLTPAGGHYTISAADEIRYPCLKGDTLESCVSWSARHNNGVASFLPEREGPATRVPQHQHGPAFGRTIERVVEAAKVAPEEADKALDEAANAIIAVLQPKPKTNPKPNPEDLPGSKSKTNPKPNPDDLPGCPGCGNRVSSGGQHACMGVCSKPMHGMCGRQHGDNEMNRICTPCFSLQEAAGSK